jgi:site-specific recombinase XerD
MKRSEAIAKTRDVLRLKHFAFATERSYLGWVARFSEWVATRCGKGSGNEEWSPARKMEEFLTGLAKEGVAASTQNQAFHAVRFFYKEVIGVDPGNVDALRAKQPTHLRYAPEKREVLALLREVKDAGGYPLNLIARLLYGCGLRVSEPLNLRVRDVLLQDQRLIVRAGKGGKDRMVSLPCQLFGEMEAQVAFAKAQAARDRAAGIPVALPGKLDEKYPHAQFSEGWAFVFPARATCKHPRTGKTVRYRCLEANVQRAFRRAAAALKIDVTPHHLRHAYATHCLDAGQNIRAIQEAMGHANIETTMGYLHADALRVQSPLSM